MGVLRYMPEAAALYSQDQRYHLRKLRGLESDQATRHWEYYSQGKEEILTFVTIGTIALHSFDVSIRSLMLCVPISVSASLSGRRCSNNHS